MFKTLMKNGQYRVDYFHSLQRGGADAFAFYVRGEVLPFAPYSARAKHHLQSGLEVIRQRMNVNQLVAVYVDVDILENLGRPAYQQMKRDLRSGMFRRVFVTDLHDLLGYSRADGDLMEFSAEIGGIELLSGSSVWPDIEPQQNWLAMRIMDQRLMMDWA